MDYKKVIGQRIRELREEKEWSLATLSQKTGDLLSLQRIGAYEVGDRMPGPSEAVILAKALGSRPAYIMAVDDIQTPITQQEEALVRNWRKLAERDRMEVYRHVGSMALQAADPVPDSRVEHMSAKGKTPPARVGSRKARM